MRRTPMSARVTPLPRGNGPQRTADIIVLRGGGKVLPFPKQPKDTIPVNAWRLVNAILEDRAAPKRAPLKAVSGKRKRENRQRAAMADRLWPDRREGTVLCVVPGPAHPADDLHEPKFRSRGGSITDENNAAPVCRAHHDWIHTHEVEAARLGLAVSSWDDPDGGSAA
jgi:hypothetical protein